MIALLGATGYTGRLVAAELQRRGLDHRLGARHPERWDPPATGEAPETVAVDVTDAAALHAFLDGADAVINTVGPFTRLGPPVVEAAVGQGVRYVDCSGEPAFLASLYERFSDAPVAVVPGCGFDYLPGDLSASLAAAGVGAAAEVVIGYELTRAVPSRGTVRTVLEGGPWVAFRARRRELRFPDGPRRCVEIDSGERVTVPRHVPGAVVTTVASTGVVAATWLAAVTAALRAAPRLTTALVGRLPQGPSERSRREARFRVVAEARGEGGERSAVACEGADPYGLTARLLVDAALAVAGTGAMAPTQALEPEPFLDSLAGDDFTWHRY